MWWYRPAGQPRPAPPDATGSGNHFARQRTDIPQEEITELLIAKAREGKTVVRTRAASQIIFGRARRRRKRWWPRRFPLSDPACPQSRGADYAGIPPDAPRVLLELHGLHGARNSGQGETLSATNRSRKFGTKVVLWAGSPVRMEQIADRTWCAEGNAGGDDQWGHARPATPVSGTLEKIPKLAFDNKMSRRY